MKRTQSFIASLLVVVIMCGSMSVGAKSGTLSTSKHRIAVVGLGTPAYSEPTVRQYLGETLQNALVATDRFAVIDRTRTGDRVQELVQDNLDSKTAAKLGNGLGVQFLIIITPIELREEKRRIPIPVPWIDPTLTKATVTFNVQVINAETGEIASSKLVRDSHSEPGLNGKDRFDGMEGFKSNAIYKAVEKASQKAANEIAERLKSVPVRVEHDLGTGNNSVRTSSACSVSMNLLSKRIMVVLQETHVKKVTNSPSTETEIIRQLVQKGHKVVDQGQINAIRNRETVLAAVKNNQAAVNLAMEFSADIIIIGEATGEKIPNSGGGLVSTRARLEARALQTDNARILFAAGKAASASDLTESASGSRAFQNVGAEWVADLLSQVCTATPERVVVTPEKGSQPAATVADSKAMPTVEIMLSNSDFTKMRLLSEMIARVSGVRKVNKTMTGNIARIIVEFDGSPDALAETIDKTQIDGAELKIVSFSIGKIDVAISESIPEKKPVIKKRKK